LKISVKGRNIVEELVFVLSCLSFFGVVNVVNGGLMMDVLLIPLSSLALCSFPASEKRREGRAREREAGKLNMKRKCRVKKPPQKKQGTFRLASRVNLNGLKPEASRRERQGSGSVLLTTREIHEVRSTKRRGAKSRNVGNVAIRRRSVGG
jgi:hypothetical protein